MARQGFYMGVFQQPLDGLSAVQPSSSDIREQIDAALGLMNGYARQPVQPVGGIFQPTAEFRRDMGRDILRLAQGVNGGSLRDGGGQR